MLLEDRCEGGQYDSSLLSLLSAWQEVICCLLGIAAVFLLHQLSCVQESSTLLLGGMMPLSRKLKAA